MAWRSDRANAFLQCLRTHGIFGNNEWNVDLLFPKIQFKNLTSNSVQLSPFEIDEGRTPNFSLNISTVTSHAHEPSTLTYYMHWAECTFVSARPMRAEEHQRQLHVVVQIDQHVRVPQEGERWLVAVPEY